MLDDSVHFRFTEIDLSWLLRDKKRRKNKFDLCEAVREVEYPYVKRPVDTRIGQAIEPDHNFAVTLEPDKFTEEKSVTDRALDIQH